MHPDVDPKAKEFHTLIAQIEVLQQKIIKISSRDPQICQRVLGSGTRTPPGVELWRTNVRICCAVQGIVTGGGVQPPTPFARSWFHGVKIHFLKTKK